MRDLIIPRASNRIEQAKNTLHTLSGRTLKTKLLLGTLLTSSTILGPSLGSVLGVGTASEIGITIGGIAIGIVGSTLVGITTARDGQMKRGALEGALIGLGITGCTIASTALLQGSTVSALTASALLGAGGAGGALLATGAGVAAKTGTNNLIIIPFSMIVNLAGGALLATAVLSILGRAECPIGHTTIITAELLAGYIALLSQDAVHIDKALSRHLYYSDLHSKKEEFADLLAKKVFYDPINLSDERISYSKLLHKVIKHKAPATLFEMLLKQPGIDLNCKNAQDQSAVEHIIDQLKAAPQETIYWEYLKCLLENSKIELFNSDGNRGTLYKLCKILDTKLSQQEQDTERDDTLLTLLASYCTQDNVSEMPEKLQHLIIQYLPAATKSASTAQNYSFTASTSSEILEVNKITTFGNPNWESALYLDDDSWDVNYYSAPSYLLGFLAYLL